MMAVLWDVARAQRHGVKNYVLNYTPCIQSSSLLHDTVCRVLQIYGRSWGGQKAQAGRFQWCFNGFLSNGSKEFRKLTNASKTNIGGFVHEMQKSLSVTHACETCKVVFSVLHDSM
eukprot:2617655-Amphidinium_carterae.1